LAIKKTKAAPSSPWKHRLPRKKEKLTLMKKTKVGKFVTTKTEEGTLLEREESTGTRISKLRTSTLVGDLRVQTNCSANKAWIKKKLTI